MAIQNPNGPLVPGLNKQLNRARNVPLIGPWLGRVGKVNRILGFPCHPTPEIWITAAIYAGAHAVMHVFSPTCIDFLVARAHGQRTAGRHGGGKRGGPGRTRKPRLQLDPNKIFPFPNLPSVGPLGDIALRSIELARFIGYWLTIIDATTEGLVMWSSLSYQWSGCLQPGGAGAQAHATPNSVILFQHAWLPYTEWIWDQTNHVFSSPAGFTAPRRKRINVSWSLSAHPPPEIPGCNGATYNFRLSNSDAGVVSEGNYITGGGSTGSSKNGLYLNDAGFPGDTSMRVEYFIDGCGFGIVDAGHITYTESPVDDMFTPMEPCPVLHGPGS